MRAPLAWLSGIVVFEQTTLSPFLIARCAEDGRNLVCLDRNGRFKAWIEGPQKGTVLLRCARHLAVSDPDRPCNIARQIVAAKIQNSRQVLLRAAREAGSEPARSALSESAQLLAAILEILKVQRALDGVRGHEGNSASACFGVFGSMVRSDGENFSFDGRTPDLRGTGSTPCSPSCMRWSAPSARPLSKASGSIRRSDTCTRLDLAALRSHPT